MPPRRETPPAGLIRVKLTFMGKLKFIDGGRKELERKKHLLLSQPWRFSAGEFQQLCKLLKIPRAEEFDLRLIRLQHQAGAGNREAAAILATFHGDEETARKILDRERRRRLLKPVTSGPQSPPQSA